MYLVELEVHAWKPVVTSCNECIGYRGECPQWAAVICLNHVAHQLETATVVPLVKANLLHVKQQLTILMQNSIVDAMRNRISLHSSL